MSDVRYHSDPVEFSVDDSKVARTYSLPIFDAIGSLGGYALVEWTAPRTYSVTGGFSDIGQVRDYLERRPGVFGPRVYFYEPGTWFGQVFCPEPGREWPDDYEVRLFARRAQVLEQLGIGAPGQVGH